MSEFNTLGVPSCTRSVRKQRAVIFCALLPLLRIWILSTSLDDGVQTKEFDALCLALLYGFVVHFISIKTHQWSHRLHKSLFFHLAEFLHVLFGAEDAGELCLVSDVVNLFRTHRIKETNWGMAVVHVCNVSRQPLRPVFWPDSNKTPRFSITLWLSHQIQFFHALSNILSLCLDFLKRLPDVGAIALNLEWFAGFLVNFTRSVWIIDHSNEIAVSEIGSVWTKSNIALEIIKESKTVWVEGWLVAHVIPELFV